MSRLQVSINFDDVSLMVIGQSERLVDIFTVGNDLLLSLQKTFSDEVVRLHAADWE
jgi:hypothetical protein